MLEIKNYPIWPELTAISQEISREWGFNIRQSNGFVEWLSDISRLLEIRLITPGQADSPFKSILIAPFISQLLTPSIDLKRYSLSRFLTSNLIKFGMVALLVNKNGKVEKWHQSLLSADLFLNNNLLIEHINQTILLKDIGAKESFQEMDENNLWMMNETTVITDWQLGDERDLELKRNNISNRFRQNHWYEWEKRTHGVYNFNVKQEDIQGCLSVYDLVFMPYKFLIHSKPNALKILLSKEKLILKLEKIMQQNSEEFNRKEINYYINQYSFGSFDINNLILRRIFNKLHDRAYEKSRVVLKQAIGDFTRLLDMNMLRQAENSGARKSGLVYNWLIDGLLKNGNNTRAQALKAYPALVHEPTAIITDSTSRNDDEIQSAIDHCLPLEPVLARSLGVPEMVIRSFQGLQLWDEERKDFKNSIDTIKCLVRLEPDLSEKLWPKPEKKMDRDWEQWQTVNANVYSIENLINNHLFEPLEAYQMHENTFKSHMIGNSDGIEDMIVAFKSQLLAPLITDFCRENNWSLNYEKKLMREMIHANKSSKELLVNSLVLNRTPAKIIGIAQTWHREIAKINAVLASRKESWPQLFDRVRINDYTFECLSSAQELEQESKDLNHCVRGYTNKCWLDSVHIIGVRKNGVPISTIELKVNNIKNLEIVQHLGKRNIKVSLGEKYAASIMLSKLKNEEIRVDWIGLKQALEERLTNSNEMEIARIVGYDPMDRIKRNGVLTAWSFAIPRGLREISYDEWVEKLELKQSVEKLTRNIFVKNINFHE